jgi:hypothetical protein
LFTDYNTDKSRGRFKVSETDNKDKNGRLSPSGNDEITKIKGMLYKKNNKTKNQEDKRYKNVSQKKVKSKKVRKLIK